MSSFLHTPPPDCMHEAILFRHMETVPSFTIQERKRFDSLTSMNFNEFFFNGEPRLCPERHILYKANRLLERFLDVLIDMRAKKKSESIRRRMFHVFVKLGHITLLGQDWARALSAYQSAYRLISDEFWRDPANYYGLGLVYLHFKEYKLAADAFSRLLYSFPSFDGAIETKTRLAVCYQNISDFGRASKYYNQALADTGETSFMSKSHVRFNIALSQENNSELDKAEADYKTLLEDLRNSPACSTASDTASVSGNGSDSLPDKPELYSPEQLKVIAAVYRQLGWIEYRRSHCDDQETRTKHLQEAEKNLTLSQNYESSCGTTFYYLGRCYGEIDERAHDAFVNYRQSIDKSEASADTWCSIGALYQKQTQPMDALQAFICAVELDPEHSAAWTDLGELYEKNAQYFDALECFRKAVKYNPCAPEPLKARIVVLEKELNLPAQVPQRPQGTQAPKPLPSLKDAWTQPIPSELRGRQEEFYRVKEQRYRDGSLLWRMGDLSVPQGEQRLIYSLNDIQVQIMQLLYMNRDRINETEKGVLEELEIQYRLAERHVDERLIAHLTSSLPSFSEGDVISLRETGHLLMAYENGETYHRQKLARHTELPTTFSLLSRVLISPDATAKEILDMASIRAEKPRDFYPIFDEDVPAPMPPERPKPEYNFFTTDRNHLLRPTPLLIVESRKDAQAIELQRYCEGAHIALIRGLTGVLRMDLSLFSTKTLLEVAAADEMEVRTQYRMPTEVNVDHLGTATWECYSTRKFTSVTKYAQYQAETFKHSLKEEAEKLRQTGTKYSQQAESAQVGKRRKGPSASSAVALGEDCPLPLKTIKFGTNVDLSDDNKWRLQLQELSKMPPFCRLIAGCNMLSHLGHTVLGMNTVQLYMKVPGSRTPAHMENNCFASVNINIGPGDCEWFGCPHEYWGVINEMCNRRGIDFLRGSYWPNYEDLLAENIPVYRFTQKAGDLVWVGGGCIHWVQATGWCNNIAWNVGPMTCSQLSMSTYSYEWNKLQGYKSLVPMQHLAWQLAKNIHFHNQTMYTTVRYLLIRSLAFCKMVADFAVSKGKSLKPQSRTKGEVTHYCTLCEIEVFNILFVKEVNGKFPVYCVYCSKRSGLDQYIVLQQITFSELAGIYDNMVLNLNPKGPVASSPASTENSTSTSTASIGMSS